MEIDTIEVVNSEQFSIGSTAHNHSTENAPPKLEET